jgi:predicted neuraminidase
MVALTADASVQRRFVVIDDPRWAQAHGSSVLATSDGALLCAWFAGTEEGAGDTAVWLARKDAGQAGWGTPSVVLDGPDAHWNPVLGYGPDGEVWLFAKRGPRISTWTTWVRRSTDEGRTWTEPRPLVAGDRGGRGPVRNPPLLLPDGTWLAPGSTERWGRRPRWDAFIDVTTDRGQSWQAAPIPLDRARLRGAGLIQPALWTSGSRVLALLRSSEGTAYRSTSDDSGRSWSLAHPTSLPNNNSGLAVLGLNDSTVVCAHNPTTGDWADRCPLVLSVSHDDGFTWRTCAVLDDGCTPVDDDPEHLPSLPAPGAFAPSDDGVRTTGLGEYSYPAMTQTGNTLTVSYTWQRRGIVEATLSLRA